MRQGQTSFRCHPSQSETKGSKGEEVTSLGVAKGQTSTDKRRKPLPQSPTDRAKRRHSRLYSQGIFLKLSLFVKFSSRFPAVCSSFSHSPLSPILLFVEFLYLFRTLCSLLVLRNSNSSSLVRSTCSCFSTSYFNPSRLLCFFLSMSPFIQILWSFSGGLLPSAWFATHSRGLLSVRFPRLFRTHNTKRWHPFAINKKPSP